MNINEYQSALQTELTKIIGELESIATQNPTSGDWVATPISEEMGNADENVTADIAEEWETRRALMAQLETRYRNVLRAVEKVSVGTYGLCEICNTHIEEDRLAANPAARTCITHLENEAELPL